MCSLREGLPPEIGLVTDLMERSVLQMAHRGMHFLSLPDMNADDKLSLWSPEISSGTDEGSFRKKPAEGLTWR